MFDCSSLQNIELPESIQYIGGYSFRDCYISSIQIPEKVTYIGEGAFEGCEQLKDIYIPDTTEEIGEYAFRDTQWFSDQPSGVVYAGKVAYDYKYSYDGSILGDTIELKNDTVGIAGGLFTIVIS